MRGMRPGPRRRGRRWPSRSEWLSLGVTLLTLGIGVFLVSLVELPQSPAAFEQAAARTVSPPVGGMLWLFPIALTVLLVWTIIEYTRRYNV